MARTCLITWLIISGMFPAPVFAQLRPSPRDLLFTHITTHDGLSFDQVNCVFKDGRGFIWIGTRDGLNVYDANSIRTFHHLRGDAHTIADNNVNQIAEDTQGNLWIATNRGLSRLNLSAENIDNFHHNIGDKNSICSDRIKFVLTTHEGKLLLATAEGMDEFEPSAQIFIHHRNTLEKEQPYIDRSNDISQIYEDSRCRIWLSTVTGLYLFDQKAATFKAYKIPITSTNPVLDNLVTSVFEDHNHQLWISTWGGGLKKFLPEENKCESFKWNEHPEIASADNIIFSLAETRDRGGNYHLWAGTPGNLMEFDRSQSQWLFYNDVIRELNTPANKYIHYLLCDNADLLWLSTDNGVAVLDPNKQFFVKHNMDKSVWGPQAKQFGGITNIRADGDNVWVTTWYGNGLYKFNKNFQLLGKWFTIPPSFNQPDNYQVSDVIRAGKVIWVSTFNGLVKMDEEKNYYKIFLPDSSRKGSIASGKVIRVFIDSHGLFWVIFYRQGFEWFDSQKQVFTPVNLPEEMRSKHLDVTDIVEDNSGNIWISCPNRLIHFERETGIFTSFKSPELLPSSDVECLLKDHTGKIWAGTREGVSIIDPHNMKAKFVTSVNGLSNDNVTGMLEDGHHLVWIATENGLNVYDPVEASVRLLRKQDGLEGDNLSVSFSASGDGRFFLGGYNSITEFYPDSLSYNKAAPPVLITSFKIFGEPALLNRNRQGEKQITLSYNQNEFSMDFAVLNYTNPSSNKYYALMEGFEHEWRVLKKGAVSYTNLDPGQYVFRVKGANNDGVMNERGDFLRIVITPPFWKTWWFRISATVFVSVVVAFFASYRINQIKNEEASKTEFNRALAETRMQALRAQMNPHFIFNSLNSIQECVVTGKNEEASIYLGRFSKLVRMILENSVRGKITLAGEIEALQLYLEVESLRFSGDFNYSFEIEPGLETELIKIPPMLIQPYVENALWHGLAHKEGEKRLYIRFKEQGNVLICEVEDNGIGRKRARAYQQKTHRSVALKNTSERLNLLGAQASVEIVDLKEPSGTEVVLKIPV